MIAPIRRQIVVPVSPARSFEIFTGDIGLWWPMAAHSVGGETGTVAFRGDELVETDSTGAASVWGTILQSSPGELLALSWFPGHSPANATEVRIHFASVESAEGVPSTLVTLEHDGWERLAHPEDTRAEYENGWPTVISRFGRATLTAAPADVIADTADVRTDTADRTWLMLRHSAGPEAPAAGPIFAHPDFPEHAAFLGRMAAAGVLVAAGPLSIGDQPGAHGMAVLRVPTGQVAEYLEMAATQDQSVVRGLLQVQPVKWNVMLHS